MKKMKFLSLVLALCMIVQVFATPTLAGKAIDLSKKKYWVKPYSEFNEGLLAVSKDDKWGFIDKKGKEVIKFKYDEVGVVSEDLIPVRKGKNWSYIDKTGKEKIKLGKKI